jgi:hypothetical protein
MDEFRQFGSIIIVTIIVTCRMSSLQPPGENRVGLETGTTGIFLGLIAWSNTEQITCRGTHNSILYLRQQINKLCPFL